MIIPKHDRKLIYLPIDCVLNGRNRCDAIHDSYWICEPRIGLLFYLSKSGRIITPKPQCNEDKDIAERLRQLLYPWAELKKITLVLAPLETMGDLKFYYEEEKEEFYEP